MEFQVHRKDDIKEKQKDKFDDSDIDLAFKFAKNVHKEFGHFLKAVVLFGSKSRNPHKPSGDVDILLVIDDLTFHLSAEVVETYRIILEKHILKVSKRIHVTTLKFTSFWDYIRVGDPVGLNILRDGVALIDTGFFTPLQVLLFSGKIRPSQESTMNYIARAPQALHNAEWHILQGTLDLYWACIDAAHAALMKAGHLPPRPSEVAETLKQELVPKGYIGKKAPKTMDMFYKLSKKILHKQVKHISGKQFDEYNAEAKEFVKDLKHFVFKKKL